jgi:predicted aspartyl protease/tetratricopeptide (TPR) repeat protein
MVRANRFLAVLAPFLLPVAPAAAEEASDCHLDMVARLPVVMEGSRASIPVSFNGRETRLWLDSGAFFNLMPQARAAELGLPLESLPVGFYVTGIGGNFTPMLTRVRQFGFAGARLNNIEFVVGGSDSGNGYLGANFLGVMTTEFDFSNGVTNFFRETGCAKANLAYWGKGATVNLARLLPGEDEHDKHIYVEVTLNGHALRAVLDTGAPTSIITRHAALRAGIDLAAPEVVASEQLGGLGSRTRATWIVRVPSLAIGGEEIRNSPIRVIDDHGNEWRNDMLLGMDFLMAHHVMVSPGERRMFFTYNGGAIFSATTERELGKFQTRTENLALSGTADPRTAEGFAGRASARLLRGDAAGAVADYDAAIAVAPRQADLLAGRADALEHLGKPDLAARDIDAALVLAPADPRWRLRRGVIRLDKGDRAGAMADLEAAVPRLASGTLDVVPAIFLFERLGLADRGLALLDPLIATHRQDVAYPGLLNDRAWNRALANADLDRARKDIETALARVGTNPAMLDTRALVRLRQKDFAGAIADETTALAASPKLAPALYLRGLAHLAGGDAAAGRADIAAARAINPKVGELYAIYGMTAP